MCYRIAGIDVHKKMLAVVVSDVCGSMVEWPGAIADAQPSKNRLEGFPSSGSSTQKRPLEKRGRGLIQNE
jgi:hypothetical protein